MTDLCPVYLFVCLIEAFLEIRADVGWICPLIAKSGRFNEKLRMRKFLKQNEVRRIHQHGKWSPSFALDIKSHKNVSWNANQPQLCTWWQSTASCFHLQSLSRQMLSQTTSAQLLVRVHLQTYVSNTADSHSSDQFPDHVTIGMR